MTSINSILAAFGIILLDLVMRAGLDKVLAYTGGPSLVGLWAQLQSVAELVGAVAIAGVTQGLTVMVAQARNANEECSVLRSALKLSLGTSVAVALVAVLLSPMLANWLTQGRIGWGLFPIAAAAGCILVIPATLNAYWLGKHMQQRMLGLALVTSTVWLAIAAGAWQGLGLQGMIMLQIIALLLLAVPVWCHLVKLSRRGNEMEQGRAGFGKLSRFVPVGLTIGLMSPVSMLLIRGQLSGSLSWDQVGILQALWRSTEWVTSTAAGFLTLIFLPRFSSTFATDRFRMEVTRAAITMLIPAALLLLLIFLNQRIVLSGLYDPRFAVNDRTAMLFLLGCWMRIASWVFLFGLYAAHRTLLIMAGEFLSLPLFAFLLWMLADGMTLERAAGLYLVSYIVYFCFNGIALIWFSRNPDQMKDIPVALDTQDRVP